MAFLLIYFILTKIGDDSAFLGNGAIVEAILLILAILLGMFARLQEEKLFSTETKEKTERVLSWLSAAVGETGPSNVAGGLEKIQVFFSLFVITESTKHGLFKTSVLTVEFFLSFFFSSNFFSSFFFFLLGTQNSFIAANRLYFRSTRRSSPPHAVQSSR
jgi:FlaA1/EpsC-like NDP-sugar epimerase